MKNKVTRGQISVIALGSLILAGVAGTAIADDAELATGDVAVNVEIAEIEEPGVLAMTVEDTPATLIEEGSTDTVRQFKGTLPTVTVTDTRQADEIPDGAGWYVVGSATAFVGTDGQDPIDPSHLGWAPALVDGGEEGLVAEGDRIDTVLDEDSEASRGLVDQELLAIALDSGAIAEEGQWSANAELFLKTPATVAPGTYSSTLTLSLFE